MMAISKQNAKHAGKVFEWSVRDKLIEDGYLLIISAGSLTACDMVAVKRDEVLFVQCKAGVAGSGTPGLISPVERADLLTLAGCLPGIGHAIVAYQVKISRRHVMQFKELTGVTPDAWVPWNSDRVIDDG